MEMLKRYDWYGFLKFILLSSLWIVSFQAKSQEHRDVQVTITDVDSGWAGNSINTVVFRKNALTTHGDTQFISYYDAGGNVVVGKRKTGEEKWQLKQTAFKGNIKDAHNSISIAVDGEGYLHMAWDHHNNPLRYCRSTQPLSLDMTEKMPMTGKAENSVSYPEFYNMPNGDLLFLYRDGGSGRGNMVINKYNVSTRQWSQLHSNLIDGEGKRNAYWQACVDGKGTIHVSWVWRESPDVASNHDMCYARSEDEGLTWEKSNGEKYLLPVNAVTAEYAYVIPEKSELINQTSISTDAAGHPFIASYWREQGSSIPQYHIIYHNGKKWQSLALNFRTTGFSLSGAGSKRIPIARPQIVVKGYGKKVKAWMLFRDEERGSKVSVAAIYNFKKGKYSVTNLSETPVGSWEPIYDAQLWKKKNVLSLFVQRTVQADAEGLTNTPPQMVQVLEWRPGLN
ncbi:MAG: BNR repeat-containing protein [Chitinophagaceae bacterium]|nr:BNR repeat-containing protein [Chitinophagaceae bacterium]